MFGRNKKGKRCFVTALWILLVTSLVMVPKFVVSRSPVRSGHVRCDLRVGSKQYVPPC